MGMSVAETRAMLDRMNDPARRQAIMVQLSPEVRAKLEKMSDDKAMLDEYYHRPRWRYLLVPIRLLFLGFGLFYYYFGKGLLWVSMHLRRFIHGT